MMQRNILRTFNLQLSQKRYFKKQVRVRFAPSPTGHLHLGGLRTALYNYLFARANNGTFILRIEDTDQSRIVPGAIEQLQNDLLWAGIISDESPVRGGPNGPYIQSKRIEVYKEQVSKLLDNNSAYHCFCTEHRLDLLRREAIKLRQIPKYDNKCRSLTKSEVQERLKKGDSYCVRFKLTKGPELFNDIIFGEIAHDVSLNEGDPVIMKANGYPTYHFANVVDDHLMEITHVLRGLEWQISTPKHIMLYKAFGWIPPLYGHLPLILNADGTKLSKRQNDIQVDVYRKQGIFPLPLINYITFAGGGFNRGQCDQTLYSYADLISQFDVSKINVNSCKLLPEKLLEFNKLQISQLLTDEKNYSMMVQRVVKLVEEYFKTQGITNNLQLDEKHVVATLKWAKNRISNLSDLVGSDFAFLWVVPNLMDKNSNYSEPIKVLSKKLADFGDKEFTRASINSYLKAFADNNEVPYPGLMKYLRNLLSGLEDGPPVAEMMEILGKDRTISRLQRSI